MIQGQGERSDNRGGSSVATELRRIIFANGEVIEAIKRYNEVAKKKLPEGSIASCRMDADDSMRLTLGMRDHSTDKHYKVALKTSFIGAAMMKWCLETDVPLARSAEKTLEVVGDNLPIAMSMNLRADNLIEGGDGKVQISEVEVRGKPRRSPSLMVPKYGAETVPRFGFATFPRPLTAV